MNCSSKPTFYLLLRSLVALCAVLLLAKESPAAQIDGVAAVVNGKVITLSEIQRIVIGTELQMRQRFRGEVLQNKLNQLYRQALEDIIVKTLILQEFTKLGGALPPYAVDTEIKRFILERFDGDRRAFLEDLRSKGITLEELRLLKRDEIIVQAMMANKGINTTGIMTPKKLRDYYEENKERFRTEDFVRLNMITIRKGTEVEEQKALIADIRKQLTEGADFADMAKTYSQDSYREDGGDWGWIDRDTLKPLLRDAAFSLSTGQYSKIIEDEKNYYLLYVSAREGGELPPFEEVENEVRSYLLQELRQKKLKKWIERLREKSVVEVYL